MNSNLYVGNLPFSATEENVTTLFSKYGKIKNVNIIKDMDTGQTKGFCFIEFDNQADAQKALELNDKIFNGRTLKVSMAKPKKTGENKNHRNRGKNYDHSRDRRW